MTHAFPWIHMQVYAGYNQSVTRPDRGNLFDIFNTFIADYRTMSTYLLTAALLFPLIHHSCFAASHFSLVFLCPYQICMSFLQLSLFVTFTFHPSLFSEREALALNDILYQSKNSVGVKHVLHTELTKKIN